MVLMGGGVQKKIMACPPWAFPLGETLSCENVFEQLKNEKHMGGVLVLEIFAMFTF